MKQMITDQYNSKLGYVEKHNEDKYTIQDKYGYKAGTIEKEFLGSSHNIYDNRGNKVGKIENNFIGDGKTIKDTTGNTIGTIAPSFDLNGGMLIGLLVGCFFCYLSLKSIPELLRNAFIEFGGTETTLILLPIFLLIAYNGVCLIRNKGILFSEKDSILHTMLYEVAIGFSIYAAIWIIAAFFELIDGQFSFLEMIILVPLGMLMYGSAFGILLSATSIIFSLIIHFKSDEKAVDSPRSIRDLKRYDVITFDEDDKVVVLESHHTDDGRFFVYVNEILPDESDVTDVYKLMEVYIEDNELEKVVDPVILHEILPIIQKKIEKYM